MKSTIVVILIFATFISASSAFAQNKVVVIPLHSAKKLHNVVTVSEKGADFTDPVAAVNSIIGAGDTNRYLVVIGPEEYTLSQTLIMKPYVSIAGAGPEATRLVGSISSNALTAVSSIISGANNTSLSDLSVVNEGGGSSPLACITTVRRRTSGT